MREAIVINDSPSRKRAGDVRVYASIETAVRSLEICDVADKQLHLWDASGDELAVIAADLTEVRIEKKIPRVNSVDTLTSVLFEHISRHEPSTLMAGPSLNELLTIAYRLDPDPYSGR